MELRDFFVLAAGQNGRNDGFAERTAAFIQPVYAREDFSCVHGCIHFLEIRVAAAAVSARQRRIFTEIAQNVMPQALGRGAVECHLPQAFAVARDELLTGCLVNGFVLGFVAALNQKLGHAHILSAVQQNTVGRLTVSTGTAGFLIVALHIFRHIIVDNERYVGFVDTHAKCVGCDHNGLAVVQKIVLILAALVRIEARVIADGGQTAAEQQIADLLHVFAGGAVDDAALVLALVQQLQQLHALGGRLFDSKIQIWTVKTGGLDEGFVQTECLHNVVTNLSCCGCRKRGNERPLRQFGEKVEDFEVAWTKILSPLRDTVRFIDCDHRNRYALGKFEKRGSGQAFRRNIQQLVLPSSGEVQRVAEFLRTHRTVDARGRNACFHKRTDLILHQRNER